MYSRIVLGLGKLFSLHLQHNALTEVSGGIWAGLDSLQYLILDSNMIHSLEEFAPTQLPRLHELRLSDNELRNISAGGRTKFYYI